MALPPFGQWPSPIGAADLARGRRRHGEAFADRGRIYWLQSDPGDGGRTTCLTRTTSGDLRDLTPGWDLRTSIHAYGGTPMAVRNFRICFYDRRSGQVWVLDPNGDARAITGAGSQTWGGFAFVGDDQVLCVREDASPGLAEPQDALVLLDLRHSCPETGRVIAEGADFYFSPAVSDNGWIAWMEYDHPSMPWDATRIVAASAQGTRHVVTDVPGVSAVHPQWDADGSLVFLSDQSGYWNFYRWRNGEITRLNDHPYDFCGPLWVLAQPPYALLSGGGKTRIGCTWWRDGWSHLGVAEPDGSLTEFGTYASATVGPAAGRISAALLATPTAPLATYALDWVTGQRTLVSDEPATVLPAERIAVPEQVSWPSADGEPVVGWYYAPAPPTPHGPAPLLVVAHGGPTSFSDAAFSLVNQYFTTRGIGLLDVNYSGSAALGRAYRERLRGQWGIVDVRDCADGTRHLVARGLADPARLAIMGGSAGGFTTLAALTATDIFSAGISLYGIGDLAALARDTTKFESHYTDRLVAPYPSGRAVYAARSPINHVDRLSCPVILLQGADDPVVPPDQATRMYDAVRDKGLDAELRIYEGEGHGFRMASTIEDAYSRILAFLGQVWGFAANPDATAW